MIRHLQQTVMNPSTVEFNQQAIIQPISTIMNREVLPFVTPRRPPPSAPALLQGTEISHGFGHAERCAPLIRWRLCDGEGLKRRGFDGGGHGPQGQGAHEGVLPPGRWRWYLGYLGGGTWGTWGMDEAWVGYYLVMVMIQASG